MKVADGTLPRHSFKMVAIYCNFADFYTQSSLKDFFRKIFVGLKIHFLPVVCGEPAINELCVLFFLLSFGYGFDIIFLLIDIILLKTSWSEQSFSVLLIHRVSLVRKYSHHLYEAGRE